MTLTWILEVTGVYCKHENLPLSLVNTITQEILIALEAQTYPMDVSQAVSWLSSNMDDNLTYNGHSLLCPFIHGEICHLISM